MRLFASNLKEVNKIVSEVEGVLKNASMSRLDRLKLKSMIEKSISDLKLGKDNVEKVIELVPKYGENRWGVVNALTEFAKGFSLDTRLRIEEYAGNILVA